MLQSVPGCQWLKDVLIVKDAAQATLKWLLHINKPYENLTSEQMVLMLRSNYNVQYIRKRIDENKRRRDVVP